MNLEDYNLIKPKYICFLRHFVHRPTRNEQFPSLYLHETMESMAICCGVRGIKYFMKYCYCHCYELLLLLLPLLHVFTADCPSSTRHMTLEFYVRILDPLGRVYKMTDRRDVKTSKESRMLHFPLGIGFKWNVSSGSPDVSVFNCNRSPRVLLGKFTNSERTFCPTRNVKLGSGSAQSSAWKC